MNTTETIRTIKNYYFLGIGGIGMSAIARYLTDAGFKVKGYDRVRTALCQSLENEGIEINYTDELNAIPTEVTAESSLIVYTPAVPKDSKQLNYFINQGFLVQKRSAFLGVITEPSFNISVAGTHGKTTTSALISHIFKLSELPFCAFLGGISSNLGSNFFNSSVGADNFITVTEADEFDRSFLTLNPNLAVVTSMDADHLDIYGSGDNIKVSFFDFIKKIRPNGTLIIKHGLETPDKENLIVITYGIEEGDIQANNVRVEDGWFVFDLNYGNQNWPGTKLALPGFHNIENALAAIGIGLAMGLSKDQICSAMLSFTGVKRRFEFVIRQHQMVYIDDYAHHPTELEAFIKSVKLLYPDKKITGVFQPHLFSRTRDFAEGFSKSLSALDTCILLDIYPARELPIENVNSQMLLDQISSEKKYLSNKEEVLNLLQNLKPEVLLTIGAGDIDTLVPQIKEAFAS